MNEENFLGKAQELFDEFAELEGKWQKLKEKEEAGVLTPKEQKKMRRMEERAVWCYLQYEKLMELDYERRSKGLTC